MQDLDSFSCPNLPQGCKIFRSTKKIFDCIRCRRPLAQHVITGGSSGSEVPHRELEGCGGHTERTRRNKHLGRSLIQFGTCFAGFLPRPSHRATGPMGFGCGLATRSNARSPVQIRRHFAFLRGKRFSMIRPHASSTPKRGAFAVLIMHRALFFLWVGVSLVAGCSRVDPAPQTQQAAEEDQAAAYPRREAPKNYWGADLNTYPGDDALPVLRKSFSFLGYWLNPPPGERENQWAGKRQLLRSQGFGFAVLYLGPQSSALKSRAQANQKGIDDAKRAAAAATKEGFPRRTIIFLDIEEGGRLPATYHAYLRSWTDALTSAGYRAGVYCSGMPVNEGGGVTILTSDDIRSNIGSREMVYWVFNDACPPSPGCVVSQHLPSPSASGVAYATIWQISQSPRRKQFTAKCAVTYQSDGNCYAPSDTAHKWFLDINTATSADPSNGK
jgi:hypothetical protein